jgi:hypothetical protein
MLSINLFSDLDKLKNEPFNCNVEINDNLCIVNYNIKKSIFSEEVCKMNGIIYDTNNQKILYYGLDKMEKNREEIKNINDNFIIEELIDGPKIGLFYHNGKWNTCTNKKIDATKSIWHGPNFGVLSQECFSKIDLSKLNTNYCYTFVIQNSKCLNFSKYDISDCVLVSCRDLNVDSENYLKEVKADTNEINFNYPKKIEQCSLDLISENLEQKNVSGYIIKTDDKLYRFESDMFKRAFSIKGNQRNMKVRYLEIRNDDKLKDEFILFYPELIEMINETEYNIKYVSQQIFQQYLNKFIQKIDVQILPRFKKIIYELHKDYIETKQITTFQKVYNKVSTSDLKRIIFLLNTFFGKKK